MLVNLGLAAVLAGIAAYTDLKMMKIYNKHLAVFFLLGLLSALFQQRYDLFLGAGLITAMFLFFYFGGQVMSRIAMRLGLLPLPTDVRPIAGGDVKLAVTLALLLGYKPVLYGTLAGIILLVIWHGLKKWRAAGSPRAMADMVLGRVHAPVVFGPWLGFCTLGAALAVILRPGLMNIF